VQVLDNLEDLLNQNRRQAHGRLVEHEQLGVAHKGAAHNEHLLLAARKGAGDLATALLKAWELLVDALKARSNRGLGLRVGAHLQVLLDRHLQKGATALGNLCQALTNQLVGGRMGNVLAHKLDGAGLRA